MKKIARTLPLLLALAAPAMAQTPSGFCGMSADDQRAALAPMLDGFWEVKSQVGTLEMAGRVIPLPPGPTSTAGVTVDADGQLLISSPELKGEYPLRWIDDGIRWNFTPDDSVPVKAADFLDDEDLAVLTGCEDAMTLPRLRAEGSFTESEGRVDFELLLFVTGPDTLYGVTIGRLNNGQGTARRILSFSR